MIVIIFSYPHHIQGPIVRTLFPQQCNLPPFTDSLHDEFITIAVTELWPLAPSKRDYLGYDIGFPSRRVFMNTKGSWTKALRSSIMKLCWYETPTAWDLVSRNSRALYLTSQRFEFILDSIFYKYPRYRLFEGNGQRRNTVLTGQNPHRMKGCILSWHEMLSGRAMRHSTIDRFRTSYCKLFSAFCLSRFWTHRMILPLLTTN